jgi:hypothetical protein
MLQVLDAFIIRCLEAFSHWTQRTCGLKSDTWERAGYLVSAIFAAHSHQHWFVFVWLAYLFLYSFDRDKPQVRDSDNITLNPQKIKHTKIWSVCAILAICFTPYDCLHASLWYEFIILGYYFTACDDLPPGTSNLKRMIRSMRVAFKLTPARVGAQG